MTSDDQLELTGAQRAIREIRRQAAMTRGMLQLADDLQIHDDLGGSIAQRREILASLEGTIADRQTDLRRLDERIAEATALIDERGRTIERLGAEIDAAQLKLDQLRADYAAVIDRLKASMAPSTEGVAP